MSELIMISGVRGYIDENGIAQLNLEDCARGLGFTETKKDKEYVMWRRVIDHLVSFGTCAEYTMNAPEFIPENIFYRLAMKAKNVTAEKFQTIVADEILPEIRKTGQYSIHKIPQSLPEALRAYANEVEAHQETKSLLEAAKPAQDFVSRYVEASALKNFREVAKILGAKERDFIEWLLAKGICYRMSGYLLPFAEHQHRGYFEVKTGEQHGHAFHQAKFTPPGIAWIAQKWIKKGA